MKDLILQVIKQEVDIIDRGFECKIVGNEVIHTELAGDEDDGLLVVSHITCIVEDEVIKYKLRKEFINSVTKEKVDKDEFYEKESIYELVKSNIMDEVLY